MIIMNPNFLNTVNLSNCIVWRFRIELPLIILSVFLDLKHSLQKLSNFVYIVASSTSQPVEAPNFMADIV